MFIVQSFSTTDELATTVAVVDRAEALALAKSWKTIGRSNIRSVGDGRLYSLKEFSLTKDGLNT